MADITLVYDVAPTVQRQSVQVTRIGEVPSLTVFVAPPPPNWARANNSDEQLLQYLGLYPIADGVTPPGGGHPGTYQRTIVLRSEASFDQNFSTPDAKKSATRALFSSRIGYHLPSRQVVSAEPVVSLCCWRTPSNPRKRSG